MKSEGVLEYMMDAVEVFHTIYASAVKDEDIAKKGSHTEVHFLDGERLYRNMVELARSKGLKTDEQTKSRIRTFATEFARRFVIKVGRTSDYTVRLGGKEPAVLPRSYVSEAWGPMGFSIYPTWNKLVSDSKEATRLIPYFFHGEAQDLFLPHLVPVFQEVLRGERDTLPPGSEEGLFLVKALTRYEFYSVFRLLAEDPYTAYRPATMDELKRISSLLRTMPLDAKLTEELRRYMESTVEVGLRGLLRRMAGLKKPTLKWETAKSVIMDAFSKHVHELFVPPEINYYIPAPWLSPQELNGLVEHNRRVLSLAVAELKKKLGKVHIQALGEKQLERLLADLFTHLHDYPEYELEEHVSLVSPALMKVAVKSLSFLVLFLNDVLLPDRLNSDVEEFLKRTGWWDELTRLMPTTYRSFLVALYDLLLEYILLKGIKDGTGRRLAWKPITNTFITIQEKADYLPAGYEVIDVFSLESLFRPQYRVYLYKYPQLAEKLIVFFVMALRYLMETDFAPDLRPDDAFVHLILLGVWGWMTENMLITLYRRTDGSEDVQIRFIDNKDQFKMYRREVDRKYPLGIAKYALHQVGDIAKPALLRAVATFTLIAYENSRGPLTEEKRSDLERHLMAFRELVLGQIERAADMVKGAVATVIDDVTHLLIKRVHK